MASVKITGLSVLIIVCVVFKNLHYKKGGKMFAFNTVKLKENLSCIAAARMTIMTWIQTFLNTNPDSAGIAFASFEDIACVLDEVKTDLKKWLDVLWLKISKEIPHGIYSFADYFSAIKPEILFLVGIIKKNMYSNLGEIKKRELIQLLSMLHARVIDQKFTIERFIKLFSLFSGNINSGIRKLFPVFYTCTRFADAESINPDIQKGACTEINISLHRFNKATLSIVTCLSEIYDMWDNLIQKITFDIQILKQPAADVAAIEDLQTLDQAEECWKRLEQVVRA